MGKRARARTGRQPTTAAAEVAPRQPCPCGSGRRYRNCHGSASGAAEVFGPRPFEGLPGECDLIAMREMVPAATAPVSLQADPDRPVVLCSLLPMVTPGLVRADGTVWLGLQVRHAFGDPSRDLAAVLESALDAAPGSVVGLTDPPGSGPRLQDLLSAVPLEVTVHEGFDFWLDGSEDPTGQLRASLESANAAVNPTARLGSVEAAYWTSVGTKEHLRWVRPEDEEQLLSALARLRAAGRDRLVDGSRLVGAFRAHGRLVPVWDLPVGTGAEALEEPSARLQRDLTEALAEDRPLTAEERAARHGLASRQLTIR